MNGHLDGLWKKMLLAHLTYDSGGMSKSSIVDVEIRSDLFEIRNEYLSPLCQSAVASKATTSDTCSLRLLPRIE
jgi:hypothetical protein